MKISENEEKRKKWVVILPVLAVVVVLAVIIGVTLSGNQGGEEETLESNGEDIVSNVESENVTGPQVAAEPTKDAEPTATPEPEPEEEIAMVFEFTAIDGDENSLKQLVLDTLSYVDQRMEHANGSLDGFSAVTHSIENGNYSRHQDLLGIFSADGVNNINLTTFDVCGWLGSAIKENADEVNMLPTSWNDWTHDLSHLVAFALYKENVSFDDLVVSVDNANSFYIDDHDYDVNFRVSFDAKNESWVALIGNINGEFSVLDIINDKDLNNLLVASDFGSSAINVATNDPYDPSDDDLSAPNETSEPTPEVTAPSNASAPDSWYQAVGRTDVTFGRLQYENEVPVYNLDGTEAGTLYLNLNDGCRTVAGYIRNATEEENLAAIERQKEYDERGPISIGDDPCILDENGNCMSTKHSHDGDV